MLLAESTRLLSLLISLFSHFREGMREDRKEKRLESHSVKNVDSDVFSLSMNKINGKITNWYFDTYQVGVFFM